LTDAASTEGKVNTPALSLDSLTIDSCATSTCIEDWIRLTVYNRLKRKGVVVALSGGIDSSVVAALCARALGPQRVLGLCMPEADSSADSLRFARLQADSLGIGIVVEDITPVLQSLGCYARRDAAIRSVIPEYGESYKSKIVLPSAVEPAEYAIFSVVVQAPTGKEIKARLTAAAYLGIVAATNFKQRTRKTLEYYHADRLQYAVTGTPNRLEFELGFFVKNGDGAADLKPIAHLYKSQVYQLAEYLGVPTEIRSRPPTTDTYSLQQSQEEFYFSVPLEHMDLCLYARDHQIPAAAVAEAIGMRPEEVARVFAGIDSKRNAALYLRSEPLHPEPESNHLDGKVG
jgi:NAD+ synthase